MLDVPESSWNLTIVFTANDVNFAGFSRFKQLHSILNVTRVLFLHKICLELREEVELRAPSTAHVSRHTGTEQGKTVSEIGGRRIVGLGASQWTHCLATLVRPYLQFRPCFPLRYIRTDWRSFFRNVGKHLPGCMTLHPGR
jgi:hypothetical protein